MIALLAGVASSASAISIRWTSKAGIVTADAVAGADGSVYVAGSRRQSISVAATLRKYTATGDVR